MSNAQNNKQSGDTSLQTAMADALAWKKRYEESQWQLQYVEKELTRLKTRFAKEIRDDQVDIVLDMVANPAPKN